MYVHCVNSNVKGDETLIFCYNAHCDIALSNNHDVATNPAAMKPFQYIRAF